MSNVLKYEKAPSVRPAKGDKANGASEMLRQAAHDERVELLLQIRSQVLRNSVHDMRTPLLAVRGYAQLLLEEQAGPLSSRQIEYLTIIVENAAKLGALLGQIQDVPSSGQLWPETIDLKQVWREALEILREGAAQKSIIIIERIAEEPLIVAGEREKIGFVLQRLLSNAIKFTNSGGEIRADIGLESDQIVVRIADTGDGMVPELSDEMFGLSDRRDDGHSPNSQRRSIIHEIVRMHGGRISITSALGEGCIAILSLPGIQFAEAEAA